ncbi:MAG TPA: hypothetical protein VF101_04540 [Gaiellaceae bacterium]
MRNIRHKQGRARWAAALAAASTVAYMAISGAGSAATQAAPVNTALPTISGTPTVGQTLTASDGTWSNSPTSFAYKWLRCNTSGGSCVSVSNGTAKTYTLVGADAGHTMRVDVTAKNADGSATARSAPTAVVAAAGNPPRNTARPTISGTAKAGQVLTAENGSWTGNPTSFAYQWQQCDADVAICSNLSATGKTYTVNGADVGFRLRVLVTAKNAKGSTTVPSALTDIVQPATRVVNHRPSLRIISARFLGRTLYARVRICDDSFKNVTIIERDSRPGKLSYTRRFATLAPPVPCGVYTRHWRPAPRFRGPGRFTITLRARDKSRLTSLPARRSFSHG